MLITKSKIEIAVVRPGIITDDGADASIKCDEDRLKLLDVVLVNKFRGTKYY